VAAVKFLVLADRLALKELDVVRAMAQPEI
jgi:hypothetical protein